MIKVENGNKTLKGQEVLKNINLEIGKGEICGIIGNNGSGKTVLFKCILGIFLLDQGKIYIDGVERRRTDGILTQASATIETPAFLSNYTGMQNLRYLYEMNHKRDDNYLHEIMEEVGLNSRERKKVCHYSLGMKQRLAIAQVTMEKKEILILDEPMNGLDKNGVEDMRRLFLELKGQGKTIIMASHNKEDIDVLCDHVYEMEMGVLTNIR